MHLRLTVTSRQALQMGDLAAHDFDEGGGSIGRDPANAWALPDPERVLSRHHALIGFANGRFTLTDTSTNGIAVNGQMMVQSQPQVLNEGDRITIGDYDIAVSLEQAHGGAGLDPFAAADPFADLMPPQPAEPTPEPLSRDWPEVERSRSSEVEATREAKLDPLLLLGDQDAGPQPGEAAPPPRPAPIGPQADNAPPQQDIFEPPPVPPPPEATPDKAPGGVVIPEDWDPFSDEPLPPPPPEPPQVQPPEPAPSPAPPSAAQEPRPAVGPARPEPAPSESPIQPQPASIPPGPAPSPPGPAATAPGPAPAISPESLQAAVAVILAGAGMPAEQMRDQDAQQFLDATGQIFREIAEGMMQVLRARSQLKNEFRMPRTELKPVENNPLKFCVNADEALHTLLFPRSDAYLGPRAAFRDGFEDIKDHQVAMMAGMQAAFESLMRKFDPETLQEEWHKDASGTWMRLMPDAAYWGKFKELYSQMTRDSGDHFQRLFGEEFGRAYEAQMARLTQAR